MVNPRASRTGTAAQVLLLVGSTLVLSSCSDGITGPSLIAATSASKQQTGNDAPSGPHYDLNLVATSQTSLPARSPNQGNVIKVALNGRCEIDLTEGPFQVLDYTCLDGDRAEFALPNPDGGGVLAYSVYIRAVSSTKGSATLQSCYTDGTGTWCNSGNLIIPVQKTNPPTFQDVSVQMLEVCNNGQLVPLFSDPQANYFWRYDNTGQRIAQVRFYPLSTAPTGGACSSTPG